MLNTLCLGLYIQLDSYVVDHEEWGIKGNPWAAGHEGQNKREHREDQSEQDPAIPGLQCYRGRSMKKYVHFRLNATLFYCIEQFSIKSAILVKLTFVMGVELCWANCLFMTIQQCLDHHRLGLRCLKTVLQLLDVDPNDQEEDGANIDLDSQRKGKCAVIKTSTRQVSNN